MNKVPESPQPNDRFLFDVSLLYSEVPIWVIGTVEDCPSLCEGERMVRFDETFKGGCFHGADRASFQWEAFAKMKRIKSLSAKRLPTFGELTEGTRIDVRATSEGKFVRATIVGTDRKFIRFDTAIWGRIELTLTLVEWARLIKMHLVRMPKVAAVSQ